MIVIILNEEGVLSYGQLVEGWGPDGFLEERLAE